MLPEPQSTRQAGQLGNTSGSSSLFRGADARWRKLMGPDYLSLGEEAAWMCVSEQGAGSEALVICQWQQLGRCRA